MFAQPVHSVSAATVSAATVPGVRTAARVGPRITGPAQVDLRALNYPKYPNPGYTRVGSPVDLAARLLPADATGSIAFSMEDAPGMSVPLGTATLSRATLGDYIALGDSITYDGYLADPAQRYPALVGSGLGLVAANLGATGYTACDMMPLEAAPHSLGLSTSVSPLFSVLVGTNDISLFGDGAHEAVFNLCDQAVLSWLGVPRRSKVLPGDAEATVLSGGWAAGPAFGNCCWTALTTTTAGTARFAMTTDGGAAYLWYLIQSGTSGAFTVSVDGGAASAPVSTQPALSFGTAADAFALLRVPVGAGPHFFDITAQSGTVGVLGVGTVAHAGVGASPSTTLPMVLSGDIPNMAVGSLGSIANYTSDIAANVALLRADGMDIRLAPTQNYMLGSPPEMMDSRHPNALGLTHMAAAFLAAATPFSAAPYTMAYATAGITTSALPVGGHKIVARYSGDSVYAAAQAEMSVVIYDGSSHTTLQASGTMFTAGSPITLTSAVLLPNVNGMIDFEEQTGSGSVVLGSQWITGGTNGAALTLAGLPVGQHNLVAHFEGNGSFDGSSSAPVTVTVISRTTTTTLSAPRTHFGAGTPVPLSAAVSVVGATGPISLGGTVSFSDGASLLAQVPVIAGGAVWSTTSLSLGVHSLSARYDGDSANRSSQSPSLAILIEINTAVATLTSLPAAMPYGTALSLNASVTPAMASGAVRFVDSFVPSGQAGGPAQVHTLGTGNLAGGVATYTAIGLAVGQHRITALYGGDTDDLAATSGPATTQVDAVATATTLGSAAARIAYGSTFTMAVSVLPASGSGPGAAPTGDVSLWDPLAGLLSKAVLVNGSASFLLTGLTPGPHTFFAVYSGDVFRSASTSAGLQIEVDNAADGLVLTLPMGAQFAGQAISLTALLTPASSVGKVIFRDVVAGILGQAVLVNGSATLLLAALPPGSYSHSAMYEPYAGLVAVTSRPVSLQILLNPTTTTLAVPGALPVGGGDMLRAAVEPSSATGIVRFSDANTGVLGSAYLVKGMASISLSSLAVGVHSLRASYAGDSLRAGSDAVPVSVAIVPDQSQTRLTVAQANVTAGLPVVVNVQVKSGQATEPSGLVSIRSAGVVVGSGMLTNASGGTAFATIGLSASTLGLGVHDLTAFYVGDGQDTASDSRGFPAAVTVNSIPTRELLVLSAVEALPGSSVAMDATVSSLDTQTSPTGTVTFLRDGLTLAKIVLGATGRVSTTFSAPLPGIYTYTSSFQASGLFADSASLPSALLVPSPVSVALTLPSLTMKPGSTEETTLVVKPHSGFSGAVTTRCYSPVFFITCVIDPVPAIEGVSTVAATMHVTVLPLLPPPTYRASRRGGSKPLLFVAMAITFGFLPVVVGGRLQKHKNGAPGGKVLRPSSGIVATMRGLRLLSLILCTAILFGLTTALCGCAEGGTFAKIPSGDRTLIITVSAGGTSVHTQLLVKVVVPQ